MLNRLQDVFKSFQQHDVKYLVIGGIASILHGVPRATFDLDILIKASPENARRLLDALLEARLGTASLTNVDDLLANEITIFKDKVRIDVQTSTPGITFEDAWGRKKTMEYHGQEFHVVSKEDLVSSKRAAARDIDMEDVRLLELPDDDNA
ncbi:MAG: nucleotidyltransferase family protein [Desulfobacterales bacterium]|nr:nucleotidyltransferase family protein [Desulfobacterales bacterium]